jgi:hypothetical protein
MRIGGTCDRQVRPSRPPGSTIRNQRPGDGVLHESADGNGIRQQATDTGGFLLGYCYNINRWLAAEGNYGCDRNSQIYFGGTGARVQSNIHQIAGSAVVKVVAGGE